MTFIGDLEKVLIDQINRVKPDILLGIAQSPLFNERLINNLRKLGVITLFWFVEDFRVLTYWKWLAPHFDIFFSIQTGAFKKALAEVGANNHYYLPVAFNNNFDEFPLRSGDSDADLLYGRPLPKPPHQGIRNPGPL